MKEMERKMQHVVDRRYGSRDALLFADRSEQEAFFRSIQKKKEFQPLLAEINEEADRLLRCPGEELSFSLFRRFFENGSRTEYERAYFDKRRRLTTFALAFLLNPERDELRHALHEIIWSVCSEFTWCLPAHLQNSPETSADTPLSVRMESVPVTIDLFAAETAFALSEISQLTKELLDPFLHQVIRQEIYRRVFLPYLHQGGYEWETAGHNWAAVCAGSIGAAALHLIDEKEDLSLLLQKVLGTMEHYLEGFEEDGTCMEGYGYWEYGFGFYVYFADLLRKRTGGKVDLFLPEKVHQVALFQQKAFLDTTKVVNFSDAVPDASVLPGLSHYLGNEYPDVTIPETRLRAPFTADHCGRWAPALRNLIWLDEKAEGQPWEEATYHLAGAQWFISRHTPPNGRYAFAAKGGHNGEPHNHNDVGQFILHGNGVTFLKDLGSGLYNKAYFGEERYAFLCNGSHGHSVPIIDRQRQEEGRDKAASITQMATEGKAEIFEIDMTGAYGLAKLKQLTRRFVWQKQEQPGLLLTDTYHFSDRPDQLLERFITPVLPLAEAEGSLVIGEEQKLLIRYDPDQLELAVTPLTFTNHAGKEEENLALDFYLKQPEKECTITFTFEFL